LSTNVSSAKGSRGDVFGSLKMLYDRRWLLWYFVQRQISGSYRGSLLGLAWLVLSPLLMVVLFTLVFSEILGLRFRETDSVSNFGLYLYCGLIPFLAFSDTLTKSVISVKRNSSLVKKVVFPLEVLPMSTALSAFVTQFFGVGVLLVLVALLEHQAHWTVLLVPLIAVPQLLLLLGLGHLAAVGGAYLPDLKNSMQAIVRALFFVTPIIWPPERVEGKPLEFVVTYNPLAFMVGAYRNLVLDGTVPNTTALLWFTLFTASVAVVGLVLFVRVKKQFADLI
jgi:ABC-2 type transport system permease protein